MRNSEELRRLFWTAWEALESNLRSYGLVLSEEHRDALLKTLKVMTLTARGKQVGRVGVPLPVGGGKTQAAVAFAWACYSLQLDIAICIAVHRVDDQAALLTELENLGIPSGVVGVLHSKPNHPLRPTKNNNNRQILLVTHSRLQGGPKRLDEYARYKGRLRDLFIYDESLVATDHWAVAVDTLVDAVGAIVRRWEKTDTTPSESKTAAYGYLLEVETRVLAEMKRQREGHRPSHIEFPELPEGFEVSELISEVREKDREDLKVIFQCAGGGARGVSIQGLDGFVWFDVAIPDELANMVVFDASLVVRLLPKINGGVRPLFPFPENIISYEDVTLHHMSHGSGRATTNEILADPRRTAGFTKEIAEVILKKIPRDEAINIFTFKDRGRIRYGERLATALERHGVRMTEKLADGRPRINVVPWGRETATNQYAYAKHTIFAGVLHRDPLDLIGATVAANRSLLADENLNLVNKIMTSEVAHSLGQAAGRSAIRYANNGKASPGSIWLPLKTPGVIDLLTSVVFPGIKVVPWLPIKADWTSGESGSRKVARAIVAVLDETRERAKGASTSVTSNVLRTRVEQRVELSKRLWEDGVKLVTDDPPGGWTKSNRTWTYRNPFDD